MNININSNTNSNSIFILCNSKHLSKSTTLLKLIFITIYFILIIAIEPFYRDYLFQLSIPFEEHIQSTYSPSTITFYNIYTNIGSSKFMLPIIFIIFISFPLTTSFSLISTMIYASYTTNTMKIIYHNPRPIWHSLNIKHACNNGFGNPSGHSCTSAAFYLSIAYIISNSAFIKKQKNKTTITLFIYIACSLITLLIMYSRLVLGAHSINQVVYGCSLGCGIYYLIFHVIGYVNATSNVFYKWFNNVRFVIAFVTVHVGLLLLALLRYITFPEIDVKQYEEYLQQHGCKGKAEVNKYQHDGFNQCISIVVIIAAVIGMKIVFGFVESKYTNKGEHIVEWNYHSKNIFKRICIIALSSAMFILNVIIPSNLNVIVVLIFKTGFAFFFGVLGMFGLGIYLCVIYRIANDNLYGDVIVMEEIENGFA